MKKSKRQQFWINHINNFRASGLSQIEYCRKHNICKGSFSGQKSALIKAGLLSPEIKEQVLMVPLQLGIGFIRPYRIENIFRNYFHYLYYIGITVLFRNFGII